MYHGKLTPFSTGIFQISWEEQRSRVPPRGAIDHIYFVLRQRISIQCHRIIKANGEQNFRNSMSIREIENSEYFFFICTVKHQLADGNCWIDAAAIGQPDFIAAHAAIKYLRGLHSSHHPLIILFSYDNSILSISIITLQAAPQGRQGTVPHLRNEKRLNNR